MKIIHYIFVALTVLLLITGAGIRKIANAQPIEAWVVRYNGLGNGYDNAQSLAVDSDGNVYVTGYSDTLAGGGTNYDYVTVKYNCVGVEQWAAMYKGPGNSTDCAFSIAMDGEGNAYVTGYSYGSGTGHDYATIKYDSGGVEKWVARYNGSGNSDDNAYSLAVDGEGNVYVTGESWGGGGTGWDYATLKYDSAGVQQWIQRYNGPGNGRDVANSIAVDGDRNVYVTGYSDGIGTSEDYATIKYNSSGVEQWVVRYNGPGNGDDNATSLALDAEGNVYVTGFSWGGWTTSDYATVKYDTAGVEQWVQRYDDPNNSGDWAYDIAVDGRGNSYVTGYSSGDLTTWWDYATIKYNSSGVEQWTARYDGPGHNADVGWAVVIDADFNVYVTGQSIGSAMNLDYVTIKYDSSGIEQWVESYDGPGNNNDEPQAMALDGEGNVYVTGRSRGNGTNYDYATIKYIQSSAIDDLVITMDGNNAVLGWGIIPDAIGYKIYRSDDPGFIPAAPDSVGYTLSNTWTDPNVGEENAAMFYRIIVEY